MIYQRIVLGRISAGSMVSGMEFAQNAEDCFLNRGQLQTEAV